MVSTERVKNVPLFAMVTTVMKIVPVTGCQKVSQSVHKSGLGMVHFIMFRHVQPWEVQCVSEMQVV